MWRTYSAAALALALGTAGALFVGAHRRGPAESVERGWTRLPNGLRVAIVPVDGEKDVAVLVSYSIGGESDPAGRLGLAHLTEHLYVTSATGASPARTVHEIEGRYPDGWDARTNCSRTNFLTVVPASSLDAELADAAARMGDLRIEQPDLDRERPRVVTELAEEDDARAPILMALERAGVSRNAVRAGGVREEVERISLEDARDRWTRFYKPANARLVLAGAVDPANAAALVAKWFDRLPRGEPAPAPAAATQPQPGTFEAAPPPDVAAASRRRRSIAIAQRPQAADDADLAALFVLEYRVMASRAAQGEFLSFHVETAERQFAVVDLWRGDERPVDDVVRLLTRVVDHLADSAPSAAELNVYRDASRGSAAGGKSAAAARSVAAAFDAISAPHALGSGPDRIAAAMAALTKDDLERLADKWFTSAGRVVVVTWK